jgi:hypothetical protein
MDDLNQRVEPFGGFELRSLKPPESFVAGFGLPPQGFVPPFDHANPSLQVPLEAINAGF